MRRWCRQTKKPTMTTTAMIPAIANFVISKLSYSRIARVAASQFGAQAASVMD